MGYFTHLFLYFLNLSNCVEPHPILVGVRFNYISLIVLIVALITIKANSIIPQIARAVPQAPLAR